ncbi:metal ABC transporter substrate-binding protein [Herbihabitans rhizosphaerae]|nr:zinc ABC transporter substrate-binding protein [Herbihabitans rhizosphaerae]
MVNVWALGWLVEQIGGELVGEVKVFESKPHEPPAQGDIDQMRTADSVLYIGNLSAEAATALGARAKADPERFQDISALDNIALLTAPPELGDDRLPGNRDPHVWLDPAGRMVTVARKVARSLVKAVEQRPELADARARHTDGINQRLGQATTKLVEIRDRLKLKAAGCRNKTIVPEHPAYAYLVEWLELKQLPVTRISSKTLPSAQAEERRALLRTLWQTEGHRTLFLEHSKGPQGKNPDAERKEIDELADQFGAIFEYLSSLESPPEPKPGESERKYPEALEYVVDQVKKGLKC